jgi:tight adherence protein C
MVWVVVMLIAASVSLLVMGVSGVVTDPETRLVRRRLQALPTVGNKVNELRERRRRRKSRESLEAFLEAFGARVGGKGQIRLRDLLLHAGYRRPSAGRIFLGARALSAALLFTVAFFVAALVDITAQQRLLLVAGVGLLGWMIPFILVKRKVRRRQDELQRTLPDALDLMVVCVEAGLGLNQALVRVGEEMDRVSRTLAEELTLVSLEIRAGTPREEALRNLGHRTGVADIRAFTSMLIQTDRFGTSIADALRVHADELRTKRRQRAEEAAAKLTVKMLLPIIIFIFPSIFLVILGPAVFQVGAMFNVFGAAPQ